MKSTLKLITFVLAFLALTASAYAQSPREQLQQMVEQLQKTPTDNALRERVIKLAGTLQPAPAIPEEAQRRMARGTAAFKDAKTAADYTDAVREFELATQAAPWYGNAYNNLGVAQDKAEQYTAALRSLKLALLATPDSTEIKDLIYQVEYRSEKAAKGPEKTLETPAPSLEGRWKLAYDGSKSTWLMTIVKVAGRYKVAYSGPDHDGVVVEIQKAEGRNLVISMDLDEVPGGRNVYAEHMDLQLSDNGEMLVGRTWMSQSEDQYGRYAAYMTKATGGRFTPPRYKNPVSEVMYSRQK